MIMSEDQEVEECAQTLSTHRCSLATNSLSSTALAAKRLLTEQSDRQNATNDRLECSLLSHRLLAEDRPLSFQSIET